MARCRSSAKRRRGAAGTSTGIEADEGARPSQGAGRRSAASKARINGIWAQLSGNRAGLCWHYLTAQLPCGPPPLKAHQVVQCHLHAGHCMSPPPSLLWCRCHEVLSATCYSRQRLFRTCQQQHAFQGFIGTGCSHTQAAEAEPGKAQDSQTPGMAAEANGHARSLPPLRSDQPFKLSSLCQPIRDKPKGDSDRVRAVCLSCIMQCV